MSAEILVRPERGRLVPADQLAEEDISALKPGEYLLEVRRTRSPQHHRLLFRLLRKVAQACPTPLTEDALLSWVKVRTGHVEFVPLGFGKSYEAPASIAFRNMDQAQFNVFFNRVVDLIRTEVVPGMPASFAEEFEAALQHNEFTSGQGLGGANNPAQEAA